MKRIFWGITLFVLTQPVWAAYELVRAPLDDDPLQVHIYELDNGLKVYLTENHQEPKFRAEITVRAGSKNDPAEATGLAHYLEHLMFKGNAKLGTTDWASEAPLIRRIEELYEEHYVAEDPEERARIYQEINRESQLASRYAIPNEFDKVLSSLGATGMNAYTHSDRTVYLVEMPANHLRQWARLEANRFIDPVFRLFQPELEIVYEEKNRALDSRDRLVQEAMSELLYGEHPYGSQTALGSVEHLKRPSLVRIHEFYSDFYVPNNMAIAISGDIDPGETIEIIDEYFSVWEPGEVPEFDRPMPEPLEMRVTTTVKYPGEEYVLVGFQTQPLGHQDVPALKVMDMILDNANAGLINLNLNQEQKVLKAGSYPYFLNDAGVQFLYGIPKAGQSLEEVEGLLLEQVELVKAGLFEDWIIPAIVTDFKKSEQASFESNAGRLQPITAAFGAGLDWDYAFREIQRLEDVTKEDVVRVANKYFSGANAVAYRSDGEYTPPSVPKPKFDPIDIDRSRQSPFAQSILAMESEPIEPEFLEKGEDYEVVDLADGVRLFYTRNPMNDLFSLSKVYEMGSREEKALDIAAALLDKAGTESRSATELKRDWYRLGTDFHFAVGEHITTASIGGLGENFEESLDLFTELLNHPDAAPETLQQLVAIRLKQREDRKQDFNTIFAALRAYLRHGEASPFLTELATEELQALSVPELLGLVKELSSYQHDYLYLGALPVEEVAEKLRQMLPKDAELTPPPPREDLPIRHPVNNEIRYVDYETAQAQLRLEFPDGTFEREEQPLIQLFNEYFYGGMSGIVFQEMREARALAYSVWAYYLAGQYPDAEDMVMGHIGTQADKTVDAFLAFQNLWNDMPRSERRFAEAIAALENEFRVNRIGFRQILSEVKDWRRRGLSGDPRPERYRIIQNLELEDLMRFYEENIQGRAKLISILGPESQVKTERLTEYGDFQELQIDQLFAN